MRRRGICFAVVLCGLGVGPASAQTERGFVRGLGGITFGTAESSAIFGGGGGFSVGNGVQITGEAGHIGDVLPKEISDELDLISALISLELGLPVRLGVEAPVFYGLAGVRYDVLPGGRIRPFVEVQAGVAHIGLDIQAEVAGLDLSQAVEDEADVESGSQFLLGLGGGVTVMSANRVGIDVGYRYGRVFIDPAVNTNTVYGAVRFSIP